MIEQMDLIVKIYCLPPSLLAIVCISIAFLTKGLYRQYGFCKFSLLIGVAAVISAAVTLIPTLFNRSAGAYVEFGHLLDSFRKAHIQPELYRSMFMNALLFFPFGFFLCLALSRKLKPWLACMITVVVSFVLSSGIEYAQYYYCLGVPEADDILMNTIGGGIGAFIAVVPPPRFILRWIIALRESVN